MLHLNKLARYCCIGLLGLSFAAFSWAEDIKTPSAANQSVSVAAAHRLDINAANQEQLASLPGIGPSKAEAIISSRETGGRFNNLEDLQRVKGIGAKTAERLAPLVSF